MISFIYHLKPSQCAPTRLIECEMQCVTSFYWFYLALVRLCPQRLKCPRTNLDSKHIKVTAGCNLQLGHVMLPSEFSFLVSYQELFLIH